MGHIDQHPLDLMTGQPGGHHPGAQGDAQVGMNLLARDQAGTLLDHPRDQRSAGRAADQQDRIQVRRAFAGVRKTQFDAAYDFSSGFDRVEIDNTQAQIDKNGKVEFRRSPKKNVFEGFHRFIRICPCSSGEASSYRGYYIDMSGRRLMNDSNLLAIHGFGRRLGVVFCLRDGHRRYGYVNSTGQIQIAPRFRDAHPFRRNLARIVLVGSRTYGVIDQTGSVQIDPIFTHAEDLGIGRARIRNDEANMQVGKRYGKSSVSLLYPWLRQPLS
jgi:hypothetical protein